MLSFGPGQWRALSCTWQPSYPPSGQQDRMSRPPRRPCIPSRSPRTPPAPSSSSEYLAADTVSIQSTHGKKNSPSPKNTTHPKVDNLHSCPLSPAVCVRVLVVAGGSGASHLEHLGGCGEVDPGEGLDGLDSSRPRRPWPVSTPETAGTFFRARPAPPPPLGTAGRRRSGRWRAPISQSGCDSRPALRSRPETAP